MEPSSSRKRPAAEVSNAPLWGVCIDPRWLCRPVGLGLDSSSTTLELAYAADFTDCGSGTIHRQEGGTGCSDGLEATPNDDEVAPTPEQDADPFHLEDASGQGTASQRKVFSSGGLQRLSKTMKLF